MVFRTRFLYAVLMAATFLAAPLAAAQGFVPLETAPVPADGSFSIIGDALPDGRLVVWNGDGVFVQRFVNTDSFRQIASGYVGDPGFLIVEPNGVDLLLGAGFVAFGDPRSGNIYRLNTDSPQDFSPQAVVAVESHFAADLLTDDLLLIDDISADFTRTVLKVVDLSGAKSTPKVVVTKSDRYSGEKQVVANKPLGSFSAQVYVDEANDLVFVMDANTEELRTFSRTALINAFQTSAPLDFETDGVLVGAPEQFFTGGVADILPDGSLLIAGSAGFAEPGGIQLVDFDPGDPAAASVSTTLDPAGNGDFYIGFYNEATDEVVGISTSVPLLFVSASSLEALPAVGLYGVALVSGLVSLAAWRRYRR